MRGPREAGVTGLEPAASGLTGINGVRVHTGMSAGEGVIGHQPLLLAVHPYGFLRPNWCPNCPTSESDCGGEVAAIGKVAGDHMDVGAQRE
jgi:hypothetical protein